MEKGNNINFKIKFILTSIMIAFVGLFIGLNNYKVDAYNLPDYEVNQDTKILDDLEKNGINLKNYKANVNANCSWDVFYIAENYTEREGYIINYIYLYCKNYDMIGAHDIKMTLNDYTFNACWDDYTRGQGELTGDSWTVREYLMTFCDKAYNDDDGNLEGYCIYKLRLDGNFLNKDERRTYIVDEVNYLYHNINYTSVLHGCKNSNYMIVHSSVYEEGDDDSSNLDLPYFVTATTWKTDPNEIYFKFTNIGLNSSLSQIRLNGIDYSLHLVKHDPDGYSWFNTKDFKLVEKGTKTYFIDGYYVGSKYYDISSSNVYFRYTKEKAVVIVEAEKEVKYDFNIIGGRFCHAHFTMTNKETKEKINNVVDVTCKYTYKDNLYVKTKDIKESKGWTLWDGTWAVSWDGSNRDGYLYYDNTNDEYAWYWGFYIDTFDVLFIKYEVENDIIVGSCYDEGLYIENDIVYDINGVNRSEDFGIGSDGLIHERNDDGSLKDEELETGNPDTIYGKKPFWDQIKEKIDLAGKNISTIFSLIMGLVGAYIVLSIINKFNKKE